MLIVISILFSDVLLSTLRNRKTLQLQFVSTDLFTQGYSNILPLIFKQHKLNNKRLNQK